MIKLKNLDKTKTYCVYQIGTGVISKKIQEKSLKDAKLLHFDIDLELIATHISMLVFRENDWYIYESHAKTNGVHRELFSSWMIREKPEQVFCFQYDVNICILDYYVKFNPGYSLLDIARLAIDDIAEKDLFNDNPGLICSEYFAVGTIPTQCNICYVYNKPKHLIKPIHAQMLDKERKWLCLKN